MRTWEDLHKILVDLMGADHVYFQPPESVKMVYPCIRFSEEGYDIKKANDKTYIKNTRYQIVVITKTPNPEVLDKIIDLPFCGPGPAYKASGLYHYTFTLYF